MPTPYLTKSNYVLASDCPRKLWYKVRPDDYADQKQDDEFMLALAENGHQIGALARCLFPDGELIDTRNIATAIEQTNRLLLKEKVVIFEAALQIGPYLVLVDILKKSGREIDLIEVKAKSWDPKETFLTAKGGVSSDWIEKLEDVAFQTWVARQLLPDHAISPFLLLVDKSATVGASGLNQLFRIERDERRVEVHITEVAKAIKIGGCLLKQIAVGEIVERLLNGTAGISAEEPGGYGSTLPERAKRYVEFRFSKLPIKVPIGHGCKKCEFHCSDVGHDNSKKDGFAECWTEHLGNEYRNARQPVFSLCNIREPAVHDFASAGIWFLDQLPQHQVPANPRQQRQWKAANGLLNNEHIDPDILAAIRGWRYPIHFLDFETIGPAIPFFRGMHPYEVMPFQFSCHHLHADGHVTHDEFIDVEPGSFPIWNFIAALRTSIGKDAGSILRYGAHENTILRKVHELLLRAKNDPGSAPEPFPKGMDADDHMAWIDTITTPTGVKGKKPPPPPRSMIDLLALVRAHYFQPLMEGSNSIKVVLPSVLSQSKILREHYQRPLDFGTNLIGQTMWKADPSGRPMDPYALLKPVFDDLNIEWHEDEEADSSALATGGAAMMAYARIQFSDVSDSVREAYRQALLRYCELDTLAMMMIVEHWRSM
jgi:hypothetical protein